MRIILSGNYEQFKDFCSINKLPLNYAIYVSEKERLYGIEFDWRDVVVTGTFWNRKDAYDIWDFINQYIQIHAQTHLQKDGRYNPNHYG